MKTGYEVELATSKPRYTYQWFDAEKASEVRANLFSQSIKDYIDVGSSMNYITLSPTVSWNNVPTASTKQKENKVNYNIEKMSGGGYLVEYREKNANYVRWEGCGCYDATKHTEYFDREQAVTTLDEALGIVRKLEGVTVH